MLNNPPHGWSGGSAEEEPPFESGWRIILIGLLNSGMISLLLTEIYGLCRFRVLHSRTYKWIMIWLWTKTMLIRGRSGAEMCESKGREVDKSLISLFAFRWPVFWEGFSPRGDWGNEEQTQVVWSPQGVASSKITQFKYFGWNKSTNNYPKVTIRPVLPNPRGRWAFAGCWRQFSVDTYIFTDSHIILRW